MDYLQKPVIYTKSLVHLSKVSIYVNEQISGIRMKSPCVIDHKIILTLLVLPAVNYDNSYCTEMQTAALLMYAIDPFKSTNLHITVCAILIERDCFEMFELLRIWSISQYLAAPFSHDWQHDTIVALISSDMHLCPWPRPLFCLCTLPPCILTPLLPLVCWPWSLSGCSSIVRICNPCVVLFLYMLTKRRFMRCTFELFQRTGLSFSSLVKVKIHLHNSWQIYKKSNRNV